MSRTPHRPRPQPQRLPDLPLPLGKVIQQEGWAEYIPVSELEIDPRYQRDVNFQFVAEIANDLQESKIKTLAVARRSWEINPETGRPRNMVIDGQHRALALKQRGMDEYMVKCDVQLSQGSDWEADQYLALNFQRKNPTSRARYKAAVHAGARHGWHNDAAVHDLCAELDIEVVSLTVGSMAPSRNQLPAVLYAIGSVLRLHEKHPDLTRMALTAIRQGWADDHYNAFDRDLFMGLADFCARHHPEVEEKGQSLVANVVSLMPRLNPSELLDQAGQMRGNRSYPTHVYVAVQLNETYNEVRRGDNRIRVVAPKDYAAAIRSRSLQRAMAEVAPEERSARAQRGAAGMTPEERRDRSLRAAAALTPEERSERVRRGNQTRRESQ